MVDNGGIWDERSFRDFEINRDKDAIKQLETGLAEARAEIERKDKLIEQMKAALRRAKENFETMDKTLTTQCAPASVAKAAYNTGMSYLNDALAAERGE